MTTVKIYRFKRYDFVSDEYQTSRRWATEDAIKRVCGEPVGQPIEIDDSLLGREVDGMTERNFNPDASSGFPQMVK
ncbi:hypothetical protein GCM10027093_21400 [Paraburkholderia jirisanensis]